MHQRRTCGTAGAVTAPTMLVDSHVHLHDCFDVATFLDTAADNFATAAQRLGHLPDPTGCLMLTESHGVDRFTFLAQSKGPIGGWRLSPTSEPISLIARRPGALPIVLIAGRQIVCRERLEVLALGTVAAFADGQPIRETLEQVAAEHALAVLPWGVGKWHGARGRLVARLLRESHQPLCLGDNGGRLGLAPEPRLFAEARQARIHVLAGSDPLPFASQISKVARYGFAAQGAFDPSTPFAVLKRHLDDGEPRLRPFGRLESLPGFVRSQIGMQMLNRLRPRMR